MQAKERVMIIKEKDVRNLIQSLDNIEIKGLNNMNIIMSAIRMLGECKAYNEDDVEIKGESNA